MKIYFASDLHLGASALSNNRERERVFVNWLDRIKNDATAIYLLGDLFDFWFEYKHTAPKGAVRLLGKLAEIADSGIPIHFFVGNHDAWMFGYFEEELGIKVYHKPIEITLGEKKFQIGHGDGLGPGDRFYKFIRPALDNPIGRFLFRILPSDIGYGIANLWSKKSRQRDKSEQVFLGEENEWLLQHCKEELKHKEIDYFVFGHRHLPINFQLNEAGSRYLNLGEWITQFQYAVFDGKELELKLDTEAFETIRGKIKNN